MNLQQIQAAILERGIAVKALDQVVTKVQARFGDTTPRPADLAAFLDGLDVWDKLGLTLAEFEARPLSWRMDQGHLYAPPPPPVHPRRPVTRSLTPEELAALDEQTAREHLTKDERTERARVLQQTPLPPQQP